jgi:hypothetical protein
MKHFIPVGVFALILLVLSVVLGGVPSPATPVEDRCDPCTYPSLDMDDPGCFGSDPNLSVVSGDCPCGEEEACGHIFFVDLGDNHTCSWTVSIDVYEEVDYLDCTFTGPSDIDYTITRVIKPNTDVYRLPASGSIETRCGKQRYIEIFVDGELVWLGNIGCDDGNCT